MKYILYALSGGFLKGYRTVVLAVVTLLGMFAGYAVGDVTFVQFVQQDWEAILLALGILTAAQHTPAA